MSDQLEIVEIARLPAKEDLQPEKIAELINQHYKFEHWEHIVAKIETENEETTITAWKYSAVEYPPKEDSPKHDLVFAPREHDRWVYAPDLTPPTRTTGEVQIATFPTNETLGATKIAERINQHFTSNHDHYICAKIETANEETTITAWVYTDADYKKGLEPITYDAIYKRNQQGDLEFYPEGTPNPDQYLAQIG